MANITVSAGQSLQSALNTSQGGDVLTVEAGAVFAETLSLPNKASSSLVTIQSSRFAELPDQRVSPADAPKMFALAAPANATHALETQPAAHGYKFLGVEIKPASATLQGYDLVTLGDDVNQKTLDQVPHDLTFDRCYIHGHPGQTWKRGIALNSAETTIRNCYISEFHVVGQECQAILGTNGPGPFHVINNYIEAAGENLMFGGGNDPQILNLRPSDIEIRRNLFSKPMSWNPADPSYAGIHWTVKNTLELKNARRVTIAGNVFENNWADAQDGTGILFTPRNQQGTAPWCGVEDVMFTNNIIRHMAGAISILGTDNLQPSGPAERITVSNNLFYDIGGVPYGLAWGGVFHLAGGGIDIQFLHNTAIQRSNIITATGQHTRYIFRDNIVKANDYGVIGTGRSIGQDSLDFYFPGAQYDHNLMIAPTNYPTLYQAGNFYANSLADAGFTDPSVDNYKLGTASAYKGKASDGKDLGVDMDALMAAQSASAPPPVVVPPPMNPQYLEQVFNKTEASRTALYHEMFTKGYAAYDELTGNKIRFRKFS